MSLPPPVPPKLQRIMDQLSPRHEDLLEVSLKDGGVPAEAIEAALISLGHYISASSLRTYRRRARLQEEGQHD